MDVRGLDAAGQFGIQVNHDERARRSPPEEGHEAGLPGVVFLRESQSRAGAGIVGRDLRERPGRADGKHERECRPRAYDPTEHAKPTFRTRKWMTLALRAGLESLAPVRRSVEFTIPVAGRTRYTDRACCER